GLQRKPPYRPPSGPGESQCRCASPRSCRSLPVSPRGSRSETASFLEARTRVPHETTRRREARYPSQVLHAGSRILQEEAERPVRLDLQTAIMEILTVTEESRAGAGRVALDPGFHRRFGKIVE